MTGHHPADQLPSLRRLISELRASNRFYAPRFAAANLDEHIDSINTYTARMPFTTKADLVNDQTSYPPYGSNLTYPLAAYTRFNQTSATTGKPLRWLDTPESWQALLDNWSRVFQAAGVSAQDHLFFAFSFGPFLGFWTAFEAATQLRCLCIPGGGMSSEARLRAITDNHVTVICCTPTYAIHLGQTATQLGINTAATAVRVIIVAGEPGGSVLATRAHIQSLWGGTRVFDHHGMTEVGPVSYECPQSPGTLHVIDSSFLAEVVNPSTLLPVEFDGLATGELILTTLERTASPLLRYRTGDLVCPMPRGRCACGTDDLALLGGILGRTDDMLLIRGVNVYPSAVDQVIRTCGGVGEYRVHVDGSGAMLEISLKVEPENGSIDTDALRRRIYDAMRSAFNLRVPVEVVEPNSLPRFELKARRWIRS